MEGPGGPRAGSSYSRADATGPLWSLAPPPGATPALPAAPPDAELVTLTASAGGVGSATRTVSRLTMGPGVVERRLLTVAGERNRRPPVLATGRWRQTARRARVRRIGGRPRDDAGGLPAGLARLSRAACEAVAAYSGDNSCPSYGASPRAIGHALPSRPYSPPGVDQPGRARSSRRSKRLSPTSSATATGCPRRWTSPSPQSNGGGPSSCACSPTSLPR